MGACKIDRKINEREWVNSRLSTMEAIKGLLKYRYRFDMMAIAENSRDISVASDIQTINEEVFAIYIDLDRLIDKCNFNEKQMEIIELYQRGNTEEDVAKELNTTKQNINGIINSICKKIKKENDYIWYVDNISWNYKVEKNGYKTCSKCKESLPKSEVFFSTDSTKLDGFKYLCKKCDNMRRK